MAKTLLISFLFSLLICCSVEREHFPAEWIASNEDPLIQNFKRNHVKSYYQVLHGVDFEGNEFSYKSDSVNFDKNGELISLFQLGDFLGRTHYYNSYDSLNRLISQNWRSCTVANYVYNYEFDRKKNIVTQFEFEVTSKDTTLSQKTIYRLTDNLKVKELIKLSKDTIDVINYKYSDGHIAEISGTFQSTIYTYNEPGDLNIVRRIFLDDANNETDYISESTGLVDSTSLDGYGWVKYYYYDFWE